MEKTEKRTAEEMLNELEQTDDAYIHYSLVLPVVHQYAAQELAEYKAKLRHKIKELSLEFVNINAQTVFELIDKL